LSTSGQLCAILQAVAPGGSKHDPSMVGPIGGHCARNPAVRLFGLGIPRSRGTRGGTRRTLWASLPGHARSADASSAGRRGTRQARTLPARRTPAWRLTRYAVGFVRVLLSPAVAAAVSQLPRLRIPSLLALGPPAIYPNRPPQEPLPQDQFSCRRDPRHFVGRRHPGCVSKRNVRSVNSRRNVPRF